MNTTSYMDKQIMDLSQQQSKDFIDLMNHPKQEDEEEEQQQRSGGDGINQKEIVPSYDFQPIRPIPASSSSQSPNFDATANLSRAWNSVDSSKLNAASSASIRNYASLDSIEPAKVIQEKDRVGIDATIVSEIDQMVKKYMDNLLHALEGVGARLTQLESRSRHLESSVDDLRVSVGNNHGSSEGRMRQLENILREVQSGVEIIKDKQEIMDAKLHLSKLQISKEQSESQNTIHIDAPQPSYQQQLPPSINPPQLASTTFQPPNAPPQPPPQQNLPPPSQLPNQFPLNQIPSVPQRESYFPPPPIQTQEAPTPQYQLPQNQPPPPPPQYQLPSQPPYSQPPPPPPQPQALPQPHLSVPPPINPSQHQPSLGHHTEESAYLPSQSYPPNLRQPLSQPSTGPPPSSQKFYGPPPSLMYEPQAGRTSSGFPSGGYGPPPSVPSEPYHYGGSTPSHIRPPQLSSAQSGGGGGGYPQLPTARVLPHALPTASGVGGGGSGSSLSGNQVPLDDVIDKVTSMGFPRDHVRATVRRLTESGKSVDLNVVLDKLMNEGDVQPPRGWFGR